MADDSDISLRPILLGPGGGNPFSSFGKGAGFGIKAKKATAVVSVSDDTTTKKDGKRTKYGKEFLMQFMERYNKCPLEVTQLNMPEIVVSGETERDQQRQVLQKVAEEIDDRDWRTRDALPAAPAPAPAYQADAQRDTGNWEKSKEQEGAANAREPATVRPNVKQSPPTAAPAQQQQQPAQTTQPSQAPAAAPVEAAKIVRAADVGLQAYKPGAQLSAEQRAHRTIKGILNKLTPEKFERLLQQLLEVITTADVLKHTISLVFENAVEQPTYCAMYADLCLRLSKELPSFPPPNPGEKGISFRQILLNTCQDEFEGTELARENMAKVTDAAGREEAERNVKKRTMGNMRLISELYKQDMVKDWIMTQCMEDLLTAPKGKTPPEDNVEAACEMITTAGGRLSKSDRQETRKKLEEVIKVLDRLQQDTRSVPARIRFIIKDVMDLKRSNWIPRREVFTAKKLDEVRAQAEAELGMISSTLTSALPTLPTQQRLGGGIIGGGLPTGTEDIPLIPPLRSGEADGWGLFPPLRSQQASGGGAQSSKSALIGDFQPVAAGVAVAAPAPAAAAQAAPAPAAPQGQQGAPAPSKGGDGTSAAEGALRTKTEGLFAEFTSTLDKKEAALCVRELQAPDYMPKLIEHGLEVILNSIKDKEQSALIDLLLYLHAQGNVTSADLISGLATYAAQLEDLSMDFPKAPELLGRFLGLAINAKALSLDVLPALLDGDYGVEPKRDLAAAVFKAIQSVGGDAGLTAACEAVDLHAAAFLTADSTLDPSAPAVEDWLKDTGLTAVPV